MDDDNAFRHAFLIIEGRKQPNSNVSVRHVLCGESDADRESWIDALSLAVAMEDDRSSAAMHVTPINTTPVQKPTPTRSSTSSSMASPSDLPTAKPARRAASRDDISGEAAHVSNIELPSTAVPVPDSILVARRMKGKASNGGLNSVPLSSSVPTNLDHLSQNGHIVRASSELGHYPDMLDSRPSTSAPRPRVASYNPAVGSKSSLGTTKDAPLDNGATNTASAKGKVISGPSNGMPIPPGYSFGAKDSASGESNNDRDRKVKSGIFTRLTKGVHGSLGLLQPQVASRVVFGIILPDALAVSQIANLPAVAFRCIQYLEAKHAEQEEGIYRLSGSSAAMKALKERFDAG